MNIVMAVWAAMVLVMGLLPIRVNQQFTGIAKAFAVGKTYFLEQPGNWYDSVLYQGHNYWPLGPLPAIFMVPATKLSSYAEQGWIQWLLVWATGLVIYKIARKKGFSKSDSKYWVLAYTGASVYLGLSLNSSSWYFAQIVAAFLMWGAWWEYQGQRRFWLIGWCIAGLILTRTTAALVAVFFVGEILVSEKEKLKKLWWLGCPLVMGMIVWGGYNWIRFGDIFEQGYKWQYLVESLTRARSYGLVSVKHIPGNLYYLLLAGPKPVYADGVSRVLKFPYYVIDQWGMSILITSPYIVKLGWYKYKDRVTKLLWLTVITIAIPILLYYGIGYTQVGYRYGLDFFTPMFWILMEKAGNEEKKLSGRFKWLILATSLANYYWWLSFFFKV